jgi:molybdopterin converting factor small subunit
MALHLRLKYFVSFDRLMGKTEPLQVEEGASVRDLLSALAARYDGFSQKGRKESLIILRNGTLCSPGDKLSEGDEISILTPQMGG